MALHYNSIGMVKIINNIYSYFDGVRRTFVSAGLGRNLEKENLILRMPLPLYLPKNINNIVQR